MISNLKQFPPRSASTTAATSCGLVEIQTISVRAESSTRLHRALGYTPIAWASPPDPHPHRRRLGSPSRRLVDHRRRWSMQLRYHTSAIGLSGALRDRTYLRDELHPIGYGWRSCHGHQRVRHARRPVHLRARPVVPSRGIDLTASVFLDDRNSDLADVATPSAQTTLSPTARSSAPTPPPADVEHEDLHGP
ncbi:hypothetical protein HBB16_04405 [Pseudonocardia sp. MCCB 268]|nr:hypothetical protein [Pseudonocardia cytotoxica]